MRVDACGMSPYGQDGDGVTLWSSLVTLKEEKSSHVALRGQNGWIPLWILRFDGQNGWIDPTNHGN